MAEPTVQQQPVRRRLGLLVRAVPRLRRREPADAGRHGPGQARVQVRRRVLSLHLELVVTDDDGAAAALERVLGALRPGDQVYVVGPPGVPEPRVDDRPFTIWA